MRWKGSDYGLNNNYFYVLRTRMNRTKRFYFIIMYKTHVYIYMLCAGWIYNIHIIYFVHNHVRCADDVWDGRVEHCVAADSACRLLLPHSSLSRRDIDLYLRIILLPCPSENCQKRNKTKKNPSWILYYVSVRLRIISYTLVVYTGVSTWRAFLDPTITLLLIHLSTTWVP